MGFPDFPNLSSPSIHFPTHLSPLSHTHSLLSHHFLCLPHVSLTLFSQNSVLFTGNNVETSQLYPCATMVILHHHLGDLVHHRQGLLTTPLSICLNPPDLDTMGIPLLFHVFHL